MRTRWAHTALRDAHGVHRRGGVRICSPHKVAGTAAFLVNKTHGSWFAFDPLVMSQKSVEIVIGRLATDEAWRARYLVNPRATLQSLVENGLDLTPAESEALLEMPEDLWVMFARWIHPRLQKISFESDLPDE